MENTPAFRFPVCYPVCYRIAAFRFPVGYPEIDRKAVNTRVSRVFCIHIPAIRSRVSGKQKNGNCNSLISLAIRSIRSIRPLKGAYPDRKAPLQGGAIRSGKAPILPRARMQGCGDIA